MPVYLFVSGFDLQTLQKSYACSQSSRNCILFGDLSCDLDMDEHIVIKKALFGFHETEYEYCRADEEMCRSSQHSGCCTKTEGDEIKPLSQEQFRIVATKCSFKSECSNLQADVGYQSDGIPSSFSVIYFVCQPGNCLHFAFNHIVRFFRVRFTFSLSEPYHKQIVGTP